VPDRFEWFHWLGVVAVFAIGAYMLVSGDWIFYKGNPTPTMARVGGGAIVAIALMATLVGLGVLREGRD
jgi:hypothetical protein